MNILINKILNLFHIIILYSFTSNNCAVSLYCFVDIIFFNWVIAKPKKKNIYIYIYIYI